MVAGGAVRQREVAVRDRRARRLDGDHGRLAGAGVGEAEAEVRHDLVRAGEVDERLAARTRDVLVGEERRRDAPPPHQPQPLLRQHEPVGRRAEFDGAVRAAEDADLVAGAGRVDGVLKRGERRLGRGAVARLVERRVDPTDLPPRAETDAQKKKG